MGQKYWNKRDLSGKIINKHFRRKTKA